VTEQATTVITVNAAGRQEAHTFTGRAKSLLGLPWLGSTQGVSFTEGPTGMRATVIGTGLDVWEIVATWHELGENFERLQAAYHWLSEEQLRTALEYYERNTEEIEARLAREQEWTPEAVWEQFPYTRPRS
jgi:uncharacterized protein (DUF433 family)